MSHINMKSRRSFDFFAPYNEEGERCVTTVFPIAIKRGVVDNKLAHDCSPTLAEVNSATSITVQVETTVQPGTMLILSNRGAGAATVKGVECAGKKVTTLMWDGNGYIKLGETAISE
ncbi:hypothetical protein [Bacteroides neonati]|uniref:hypothetical protein n=1 Tax=Bacteroides neonati TaxID=1347393 RepID=UPI0005AB3ED3|nr:hypothetical protein [Bacteroides neonati]